MASASYQHRPFFWDRASSWFRTQHFRTSLRLLLHPGIIGANHYAWLLVCGFRGSNSGRHTCKARTYQRNDPSALQVSFIDINTKQHNLFFFFHFVNTEETYGLSHARQRSTTKLYALLWSLIWFWIWETVLDGNEGLARQCLIFPGSNNQERSCTGSWCKFVL